MFVRSRAFRKYGGFIEPYIAYYEDSEWCWRVINLGARLCYVPAACLVHKVSASVKKNDNSGSAVSFVSYLMFRNQLWTVRLRAKNIFHKSALIFFNSFIQARNIVFLVFRGQFKASALLLGSLHDGLLNNLPEDFPTWN